jgi:pantoate--beta-alanine ligase
MSNLRVITTVADMRRARQEMAGPPWQIGLVPTMGALHEGHLSLVRHARTDDDVVVVSIFVNPTQFGPSEDFARYPRDTDRDLALLRELGTDVVFMPPVEEIYPRGFDTHVEVEKLTQRLEGVSRPGHLRGVATVVTKLFNIVQPHRAYFGQKDAQQLAVIRRLARDLDLTVEVVGLPTVREPDGLAMSSRNAYLSPEERKAALVVYRSLQAAQELWRAGVRDASLIRQRVGETLAAPATGGLARVDYISVADGETLEELETLDRPALVSLAVHIGKTRLIDNVTLGL